MRSRFLRSTLLLALLVLASGLSQDPTAGTPLPGTAGTCDASPSEEQTERYNLTSEGDGRWKAENGRQRVRLVFSGEGARILPLISCRSSWEWGMSLSRYGGPADFRSSDSPFLLAGRDRVEYLRGPLLEWYRNSPKGIEHGLEIPSGAAGASLLWFDFVLTGNLIPKVAEDGQKVVFRDPSGAPILSYLDLRGLDAEGREVAARWEWIEHPEDSGPVLRLVLEGAESVFPLQVLGRLATPKGTSTDTTAAPPGREAGAPATPLGADAGLLAAPANDLCAGAEVIPGAGSFPYVSSVADITDATTGGDPSIPSCQPNVSRSVWFAFTPAITAGYTFSVCSDAPTATTVEDTVLAVYSSAGACAGLSEIAGGCNDDSCGPTGLQSSIDNIPLAAGTTYYVVAWSYGTAVPPAGFGGLQLQVVQHLPAGPSPPNDECGGAEVIPGAGPFPYLTSVTADVSGAMTAGDPPAPSCQPNVSRSVWYSFTPSTAGRYSFSVCADAPTGSTADDTVLAIYSATGTCFGLLEASGGCDDDSCASEAGQSVLPGISLSAGTRYYIVVWQYGTATLLPGNSAVQLRVTQIVSPPNDTCADAPPLSLGGPVSGTTASAFDDTRLPSGSACFTGVGQTSSTAPGKDVAYRFTASDAGRYSFRLSDYDSSRNAVLYVASDCPGGSPPAAVAGCLGASNRTPNSPEEVSCLPLEAGQSVYIYVDEDGVTAGSSFTLEASRCVIEGEPNGTPASGGETACGLEGSISPAGDADFFNIGAPETGSRVFAMVDGAAGNSTDFDLRVTTDTDTLEYDDFNNDAPFGVASPNVAGTRLTGTASYLRVSHYSPVAQAEPYRLYATVQPPAVGATPEVEPNSTITAATAGTNEYYSGRLSDAGDVDIFSFSAVAGDLLQIGLDLDPTRDNTSFNGSLALLNASGATLLMVNDPALSSSNVPGSGSLIAATPYSPGEAMVYRIRNGGIYYAKVAWSAGTPGDYLLSISRNCRVSPPTDVGVSQSDAPDPVPPGGNVTYSIGVSNLGPNPASVVTLRDDLPASTILVSAVPSQGICTGPGPVVCQLGNLDPGASAGVSLVVTAPLAPGPITNQTRVSMAVFDSSPGNDASSETTTVGTSDSDGDSVPDSTDCAPADPSAWTVPGEATGLVFPSATDPALLRWAIPSAPGGTVVYYDLLRSTAPGDFLSPTCLATGTTATSANDSASPGAIYYYLVRSENVCGGNLGVRSDGTPRSGGYCP